MSYQVRLDANARRDFDRHVAYFESNADLAHRVSDLEDDLLERLAFIGDHPFIRREVYPDVRHEALRTFSYHLWFRTYEGADFVDVFAILHQAAAREEVAHRLR